jgi:hypothetical protein
MRFSIRDLFLVTVIVALVVGWLSDHWRAEAAKAALEEDAAEMANLLAWGNYPQSGRTEKLIQKHKPRYQSVLAKYQEKSANTRNSSAPTPNPPKP